MLAADRWVGGCRATIKETQQAAKALCLIEALVMISSLLIKNLIVEIFCDSTDSLPYKMAALLTSRFLVTNMVTPDFHGIAQPFLESIINLPYFVGASPVYIFLNSLPLFTPLIRSAITERRSNPSSETYLMWECITRGREGPADLICEWAWGLLQLLLPDTCQFNNVMSTDWVWLPVQWSPAVHMDLCTPQRNNSKRQHASLKRQKKTF